MKIPTKADLRNPCIAFLPNDAYNARARLLEEIKASPETKAELSRQYMELRKEHPDKGRILVMGLTGTAEVPDSEGHMSDIMDHNSSVRAFLDRQGVSPNHIVVGIVDPRLYNHLIATLDFADIYVLN